ncbi:MAG: hypothetical protein LBD44_05810 [Spirochaetaceae bacterium]|jgi:hypothetical protein|nr:hypothetical protein [Spirochaetaceae bacterium]
MFTLQLEANVVSNSRGDNEIYNNGVVEDDGSAYYPNSEEAKIRDLVTYMSLDIPRLSRLLIST